MSNNYYKYYHLRASPITKYEQSSPTLYIQNQQPLQYSTNIRSQETSPWRIPQQATIVQSQQITTYIANDKTLQYLSLEKQNECLRIEKIELENQIQKLKQYYIKQTTLDQEELMRYEREKASLTDKLREMDQILTNLQEKYEKEQNAEKNNSRKQRQEQESKIDRITSYYNEQLGLKQDEIHKTKNKLQLSEINVTDLSAKLKIFEQTNNDIRAKWDEDIKNFGQELETLNKQILSQRFRNEELERLSRIHSTTDLKIQLNNCSAYINILFTKFQSLRKFQYEDYYMNIQTILEQNYRIQTNDKNNAFSKEMGDNHNGYLLEIEALKNQNVELRNKIFELEKKQQVFESNQTSDNINSQNNIYKDKLEQKIQEYEKIKTELNKKVSEVEIITKDSKILQTKLTKSEKDNSDKDLLVQQMIIHIEQIEKENKELQAEDNLNVIEEKLKQVHLENQIQKKELQFFQSELERITNRNKLLEEQLYQPETQINTHRQYQLLEKQIDQIDMKCNKIQLEVNKKEESLLYSQRGNNNNSNDEIKCDVFRQYPTSVNQSNLVWYYSTDSGYTLLSFIDLQQQGVT